MFRGAEVAWGATESEQRAAAQALDTRDDDRSLTFVIPVFRSGDHLGGCLAAVDAARREHDRLIVVFDGDSTVGDLEVARRYGADVIQLPENRGPAAARNAAAREAATDALFLVDVDVRIQSAAVERAQRNLASGADAVVGAYTPLPTGRGLLTVLKNVQHSFTHTASAGPIASFWSGCAAVMLEAYIAVGGMDEDLRHCEDIALGAKLHRAGYHIVLDPSVAGEHAKSYRLHTWAHSELVGRAFPWSLLLLEGRAVPRQLNTARRGALGVVLAYVVGVSLVIALVHASALIGVSSGLAGIALSHRRLLAFTARHAGWGRALAMVAMLLGHFLLGGLGAFAALLRTRGKRLVRLG